MVQPALGRVSAPERPLLSQVGCAGRITAFTETGDGRYLITLTGVARFRLGEELPAATPYRRVRADFAPFAADLEPLTRDDDGDRDALLEPLRRYLEPRELTIEWSLAETAPLGPLINSLIMALPFDPAEQQALLEAPTPDDRRRMLIALLRIDGPFGDDPPSLQ
jgi:Lon protease-like protein